MAAEGNWASLPSVVLQDIFSKLQLKDRLHASSTCHKWRDYVFMPQFWSAVSFNLTCRRERDRSKFLISRCGKFVKEVVIEFNSTKNFQVWFCTRLLENLSRHRQLECLSLKPSSSFFDESDGGFESFLESLQTLIKRNRHICHLSLGCTEILLNRSAQLLHLLVKYHAPFLRSLHLTSVKEDPVTYIAPPLALDVISSSVCLHALSIDYDFLTPRLLTCLANRTPTASTLRSLCIHIHRVGPQKLTDNMWKQMVNLNPQLEVTVNLVHSFEGLNALLDILKPSMPLTHLRQYFCGDINVAALNLISYQYYTSLCSLTIVEAIEDQPIDYVNQAVEDPFVMLAWRCTRLESLKLIGVSLDQKNLVAISRLRSGLRELTVPMCCVFWNEDDEEYYDEEDALFDLQYKVSQSLGWSWNLVPECSLPLAVFYADADADEAYMEDLLEDQSWRGST